MDRYPQQNEAELVEVGIVSADTKGRPGPAWEINAPDALHGIEDR